MDEKIHRYSNGEVTVIWEPALCQHSKRCWKGLPEVFQPGQRPWIEVQGADSETIVNQVKQCPSGALRFEWNGETPSDTSPVS